MSHISPLKYFIFLVLFTTSTFAANNINAPLVTAQPVFDGDTSDNVWSNTDWNNIGNVWIPYNNIMPSSFTTEAGTQVISGSSDFSGRFKVLWNQSLNRLFFLVEITDDVFVDGYVFPNTGYSNFDVLEVFIDENKSGGNHLFDVSGNNAENAFAYHMMVNKPSVGGMNANMTEACDLAGVSWGNYTVVGYKNHFPDFSFRNKGNNKYIYEFSLKLYNDSFSGNNLNASEVSLSQGKNIGLSIAYCDNDANDNQRDSFIGSVTVTGSQNNDSYLDASVFGSLSLTGPAMFYLSANNATYSISEASSTWLTTITSNLNWSINSPNWISASPNSGMSNGVVTITATANIDTTNRTGVITITSSKMNYFITVNQNKTIVGVTPTNTTPGINTSPGINTTPGTNTSPGINTSAGTNTVLGITDSTIEQWDIMPNPAKNYIKIKSSSQTGSFTIINIYGEIMDIISLTDYTIIHAVDHLPNGLYFLYNQKNRTPKRLIVDKN
ncbi:MAG: sugar-binding protein [Bacteroidota bacterium]|nr:sugar-binding protein [Bacteroidota bacterium]